jgi:hypothetical protein
MLFISVRSEYNALMNTEICSGCGAVLPLSQTGRPVHNYVDASASCWLVFSQLTGLGEPMLAQRVTNSLIVDAYLCQHHGNPSPQAIQSVAVHLLALYGVLQVGLEPSQTLWIRQRATRPERKKITDRFYWLAPPDWINCPTLAQAIEQPTAEKRADEVEVYVLTVWQRWSDLHLSTLQLWYQENVSL